MPSPSRPPRDDKKKPIDPSWRTRKPKPDLSHTMIDDNDLHHSLTERELDHQVVPPDLDVPHRPWFWQD